MYINKLFIVCKFIYLLSVFYASDQHTSTVNSPLCRIILYLQTQSLYPTPPHFSPIALLHFFSFSFSRLYYLFVCKSDAKFVDWKSLSNIFLKRSIIYSVVGKKIYWKNFVNISIETRNFYRERKILLIISRWILAKCQRAWSKVPVGFKFFNQIIGSGLAYQCQLFTILFIGGRFIFF